MTTPLKRGMPCNPCCGGGGTTVAIPGCDCTTTPTPLSMTYAEVAGSCGGFFNTCTLVYGATPSRFSALGLGASCFLSTASFLDSLSGTNYYWQLGCAGASYSIRRVYDSTPPFLDAPAYTWGMGSSGNTCSPFYLSTGTIYSGGFSSCVVTVQS